MGDPLADSSALLWSVTAMSEATARLPQERMWDPDRAYTLVGEAVWWVTLVDATMVRHYPGPYDSVMAGQSSTQRQQTEATLAGLRFVRNRLGGEADVAHFIQAAARGKGAGNGCVTGWRWKTVPAPVLVSLTPRAQVWEMTRYQAYQAQLAGRTIGETFRLASRFLTLTVSQAGPLADLANAATNDGSG